MEENKVIFLDIDGVLQPFDNEYRFFYEGDNLIKKLSNKYNIDYSIYDKFDILAVYYDWEECAVERLRHILNETNSKIIVSSGWRSNRLPNKMKDLLTIRNLDNYYLADNIISDGISSYHETRAYEIKDSLRKYNISNFVVLDDMLELEGYFPNNSVITHNYISINDMNKCLKILKK